MSIKQLQAGYVLDSVRERLHKEHLVEDDSLDRLFRSLCYFDIEVESSEQPSIVRSIPDVINVADNLISRGLPTRPSLLIEDHYADLLKSHGFEVSIDPEAKRIGSLLYNLTCDSRFAEKMIRALHVIDSGISAANIFHAIEQAEPAPYDSAEEKQFHQKGLKQALPAWWTQLVERQRSLTSIIENCSHGTLSQSDNSFIDQRVDFSIEFPYPFEELNGIVFEIDGSQHQERKNAYLDKKRDQALRRNGVSVFRIPASESGNPGEYLDEAFFNHLAKSPYLKALAQNYENPLAEDPDGELALNAILGPFLCARIQKAILPLRTEGLLPLSSPSWRIAIVEHDIDCAELAMKDLGHLLEALGALSGSASFLPSIELLVTRTNDAVDAALEYDALIDCAILERSFITNVRNDIKAKTRVRIRSANSIRSTRIFSTAPNITYQPLGFTERDNEGEEIFEQNPEMTKLLRSLLRNIFRKDNFRPGQIEIINRALQNQSVIGLLPTGSGKSLTYQLTALLQPGVAAVIDPLKSLMVDQCNGLQKNGIDCIAYINSSLSAAERNEVTNRIRNGQIMFAFISPERLQV